MSMSRLLSALLCLLPGLALGATATPNTSAGRALISWLEAFNSGDSARLDSFDKAHLPWMTLDAAMALRAQTGGYELLSIEKGAALWITFAAKGKTNGVEIRGSLVVKSADLAHIYELSLTPVGTQSDETTIDAAKRDRIIDRAAELVAEFYVFPDVGHTVSAALRRQGKHGAYDNITDGQVLAARLSDDLIVLSHDRHFNVGLMTGTVPPDPPSGSRHPDTDDPKLRQRMLATNCGFEKAEHLASNIGYLKLNFLGEPEICAPTAIAAMNFVADSDALIIDLRDNHGGAPRMVALLSSYLFKEQQHLDDNFSRRTNTTEQSWTLPYVPGKSLAGKTVYVLTSRQTFSAGEELSYDLQVLKRATLIGETTGGGAHVMSPHRIDDHFFIQIPFGRITNPLTKADWEGTGVEPDIKVPAADALEEALKRLRNSESNAPPSS